jgi:hypothetical protein
MFSRRFQDGFCNKTHLEVEDDNGAEMLLLFVVVCRVSVNLIIEVFFRCCCRVVCVFCVS